MIKRWVFSLVLFITLLAGALSQPSLLADAEDSRPSLPVRPTPVETPVPRPDPVDPLDAFVFPQGWSADNVLIGGLSLDQALAALERYRLAPLYRPILLYLDEASLYLDPLQVGLHVTYTAVISRAIEMSQRSSPNSWRVLLSTDSLQVEEVIPPEDLPIEVSYDSAAVQAFIEGLALEYDVPAISFHQDVLTGTSFLEDAAVLVPSWSPDEPVVAFFDSSPGRRLDVAASAARLDAMVTRRQREPVRLRTEIVLPASDDFALLESVLRRQIERMPGVVGVYVRDLDTNREVAVHDEVIFSGASVIKIAIMLQTFMVLEEPPSGKVADDLWAMMVHSENEAANRLLTLVGGGDGVLGANMMTEMLYTLGLQHSFLRNPYGWLERVEPPPGGYLVPEVPAPEEPTTDADPVLQTTPREMGLLLAYIYQGSLGQGPLLEHFSDAITSEECQSMIELMLENVDGRRIVAGLPKDTPVAHKSGWIDDLKADAGIVFSPRGTYVFSAFAWEEEELTDREGNPRIAGLSWIVYSFFNPFQ